MIRLFKAYFLPGAVFLLTSVLLVSLFFVIRRSPWSNYGLEIAIAACILKDISKLYGQRAIIRVRTLTPEGEAALVNTIRTKNAPPLTATFLFYMFMTPQNCDSLVGDLEERYRPINKKFGQRRASYWYWKETIRSIWPIAWAWGKKVFRKLILAAVTWAIAKGHIGHDSWLAAVLELLRKIRS